MVVLPVERLAWALPGWGDSRPGCGAWHHIGHESEGGTHYSARQRSCGRSACPTCWRSWSDREVHRATRRVLLGLPEGRLACHYVVSPPPEWMLEWEFTPWRTEGYRRLRSVAYAVAARAGVRGGVAVYHHVRLGSERWNGEDLGCRAGSHWHVVGDGWLEEPPEGGWGGWVVVNLGVRESVSETLTYLLSHMGCPVPLVPDFRDGLDGGGILPPGDLRAPVEPVTWFGSFSYRALRVAPEPPADVWCEVCATPVPFTDWFMLDWVGQGPPPEGSGVASPSEWRRRALRVWDGDAPDYLMMSV